MCHVRPPNTRRIEPVSRGHRCSLVQYLAYCGPLYRTLAHLRQLARKRQWNMSSRDISCRDLELFTIFLTRNGQICNVWLNVTYRVDIMPRVCQCTFVHYLVYFGPLYLTLAYLTKLARNWQIIANNSKTVRYLGILQIKALHGPGRTGPLSVGPPRN